MKKLVSLVAVCLVATTALSGGAVAAKKKKGVRQDVSGSILMQAPPSDATSNPNGCYSGVHRRIAVLSQEQVNGVVGFHFDIDPGTWNKKFRLTPGSAVDLDITFYDGFGTVEQAAETSYAPYNLGFETRDNNGEAGIVPPNTTKVIVCMKTGQQASFEYSAGAGVK
ncbi:MAG TPA: hypothetical protein VHN37_02175 [Actinomycetota bacterium]|nr:hypothetical protein [Actinomycetota bacterium]